MEFWKRLRYWQKGAIIGAISYGILPFILYSCKFSCPSLLFDLLHFQGEFEVMIRDLYIDFSDPIYFIFEFGAVMISSMISGLFLGALIGFIIGKFQKQEKIKLKHK